ncbi:hypothetical protein GCM10008023_24270 [Sphingomonas glacialis]|uniref:Transposase DDE domain-containing protein n=1 Tax=Sphingomonas glacialis TaxID=658225 RepID=A0ABQ3LUA6_9SPHN|nr:hypothetical protein GCM10008023_24270 [Sphingomonas glacialis]
MGKRAVVAALDPGGGAADRGFEREALAQHGVEQTQRGTPCGDTGRIDRFGFRHVATWRRKGQKLELCLKAADVAGAHLSCIKDTPWPFARRM